MLQVTRDVVGKIARALIMLNDLTTTLDVKVALRNKGYWATQHEIRNFMLDITSADGDIKYEDSQDGYRIYSFTADDDVLNDMFAEYDDDDDLGLILSSDFTKAVYDSSYKSCSDSAGTMQTTESKKNCGCSDNAFANYTVCDKWGSHQRDYSNVTRGQAKHKWSQDTGNSFINARTLRW